MNDEQVLGAVEAVRRTIYENHGSARSARNSDGRAERWLRPRDQSVAFVDMYPAEPGHLLWMCGQIPVFLQEGRREKAMRWLGFLQGALWAYRWRSVEAMKTDNAPEGTTIDKERV